MKLITLLVLVLLPAPSRGQVLVNQPAAFTVRTYPGNPLSIWFSLGTDSLKTSVSAVLRYAPGERAFPPESQPVLTTGPTWFSVNWSAYPALPGTQYLEVSLGGVVQVTGTIICSFLSATTTQSHSLTINQGGIVAINLQVIGGTGGGIAGAQYRTFTLTGVLPNANLQHNLNTRLVEVKAYQTDTGQYDPLWSQFTITSDVAVQIRGPAGEVCNCTFVVTPYKQSPN